MKDEIKRAIISKKYSMRKEERLIYVDGYRFGLITFLFV
jgi:hypothetical protein